MSTNSIRREKEKNFYMQHMETFKKLGLADTMFTIKTAFFQKGRYGRNVLFFEWELKKGEDIYIEFYDNVTDGNGKVIDIVPMNKNRQLFKYKYNPYFFEEYEQKRSFFVTDINKEDFCSTCLFNTFVTGSIDSPDGYWSGVNYKIYITNLKTTTTSFGAMQLKTNTV